ncbi:MAG: hypothetical protein LUI05_03090 [Oscillospiraceae bacterium]|nr:hypothetical protein [Oscillospiraceae bacterium]
MKNVKHLNFNDGVISIYAVKNTAEDGERPNEVLSLKRKARYENRSVGINRYYEAMQNNIKIAKVVVIPFYGGVDPLDVVIFCGDEGRQYRIEQVQQHTDTKPYTVRLSLSLLEQGYDMEDTSNDAE